MPAHIQWMSPVTPAHSVDEFLVRPRLLGPLPLYLIYMELVNASSPGELLLLLVILVKQESPTVSDGA